jgi:hypothetical protein
MNKIKITTEMLEKFQNFEIFIVKFFTKYDDWFRVFKKFETAVGEFNEFVENQDRLDDAQVEVDVDGFSIENGCGNTKCQLIGTNLE